MNLSDDPQSSRFKIPTIPPLPIPGLPQSYGQLVWSSKTEIIPRTFNNNQIGGEQSPNISNKNMALTDTDMAKNYFIKYVSNKCCYGKAPANECEIIKMIPSNALYV